MLTLPSGLKVRKIPSMAQLNADQKDLWKDWIAALRSGTYVQGHGELRPTEAEFCSIGVACDLVKNRFGHWLKLDGVFFFQGTGDSSEKDTADFPVSVREEYGFNQKGGYSGVFLVTLEDGLQYSLIHLNDSKNATFPDIARILEVAMNGGH
jgi:hypothetical protein